MKRRPEARKAKTTAFESMQQTNTTERSLLKLRAESLKKKSDERLRAAPTLIDEHSLKSILNLDCQKAMKMALKEKENCHGYEKYPAKMQRK